MHDFRIAGRTLLKTPLFTVSTVALLAVAMGLNTAAFSLVHATLLESFPYREPSRLVNVVELEHGRRTEVLTPLDFDVVRREATSFSGVTGYRYNDLELSGVDPPQRVTALHVMEGFFDFLDVAPLLGRGLSEGDYSTAARVEDGLWSVGEVVVLGHAFWRSRFGGASDVIGSRIRLQDRSVTVIGVMPEGFDALWRGTDIYVPWILPPGFWSVRPPHVTPMLARLRPGVDIEAARSEVATLYARLATEYPDTNEVLSAAVEPVRDSLGGVLRPVLVLFAGAVVVLLVACSNLAGLMTTRAKVRWKDVAVRRALGATTFQIARMLLVESLMLSALGCGLGILFAKLSLPLFELPAVIPFAPTLNGSVVSFSVLVMVAAVLFIGLTPTWIVTRTTLTPALKDHATGRSTQRATSVFVVAQVALALGLVSTSGLLLKSLATMLTEELGFRTDGLLTFYVSLPDTRYGGDERERASRRRSFRRSAQEQLRGLPGVLAVDTTSHLPTTPMVVNLAVGVEGSPAPRGTRRAAPIFVSHDLLPTLSVSLSKGRNFTASDREDSPWVVVVNESMAREFWPRQEAVGKRIRFEYGWAPDAWVTVIGVARDVRQENVGTAIRPAFYILHEQFPQDFLYFAIRTRGAPELVVPSVRERVQSLDPNLPLTDVRTMEERVAGSVAIHEARAKLVALYATGALVLATMGLYGMLASVVAARTRELVIRMALGATRADVARLVLGRGARELLVGLAVGLALSVAGGRLVESVLYDVAATDMGAFATTTAVLASFGLVAIAAPALRASRLELSPRLREE